MMKTRRIVGVILGVGGCLFTIMAVLIAQAAGDQDRLTEETYNTADHACREQVQKIGAIKEVEGGKIWELNVPVVVDKRTALADASAAIAACPTRVMQTFCLGAGCTDPNAKPADNQPKRPAAMVMRLSLKPGVVPVAPAAPTAPAVPASAPSTQRTPPAGPARPAPQGRPSQFPAQPMRPGQLPGR